MLKVETKMTGATSREKIIYEEIEDEEVYFLCSKLCVQNKTKNIKEILASLLEYAFL